MSATAHSGVMLRIGTYRQVETRHLLIYIRRGGAVGEVGIADSLAARRPYFYATLCCRRHHAISGAGVRGGFLLNLGGVPLKLYSAVSCVYPDVS